MTYIERNHDVITGEITERPYTADQIAAAQAAEARFAAEALEWQAKETERQAVLDKLGLTADEARLLLG
jgi:hypothetical protein